MLPHCESDAAAAVDAALTSRRSVRAFLPTPVPAQTIAAILAVASRAPSGTNTQPWKVLRHTTRRAMADLAADNLIAALDRGPNAGRPPTPVNPGVLAGN